MFRDWLAWLTSAGGLGAWRTYSYGAALGILLLISARIAAGLPPDEDGETVGWFVGLAAASAALCAGPAGFATARRKRQVLPGVLVGAVTGAFGVLLASAALVLGAAVGLLTLHDVSIALAVAIPVGAVCADVGLLAGAIGGAFALPRSAFGAIWLGLAEAFVPHTRRD